MERTIDFNVTRGRWHTYENENYKVFVKGQFFYKDIYYSRGDVLGPILKTVTKSQKRLVNLFNDLNGSWAICIYYKKVEEVLLSTDRYRSIPLFYSINGAEISVSDDYNILASSLSSIKIDKTSELQFLLSGFVTGCRTLLEEIYQVEPATFVMLRHGESPKKIGYFEFFPPLEDDKVVEDLELELKRIFLGLIKRLKLVCTSRRVFVPLSGGNDSRLIVWLLHEAGIRDVICYTYGVKDNPQRKIAEEVAERLGYQWIYIEYTKSRWQDALAGDSVEDFYLFSANGTSLPHIQDYPAVKELNDLGLITQNSIFLPGHIGDAWANEFASKSLTDKYHLAPQEYHSKFNRDFKSPPISFIIYRHFIFFPIASKLWKTKEYTAIVDRIRKELDRYDSNITGSIWKALE